MRLLILILVWFIFGCRTHQVCHKPADYRAPMKFEFEVGYSHKEPQDEASAKVRFSREF
jgi:hypothetical protein